MKRDVKNLLSRTRILDSALTEFAERGYGLSSVNTICAAGDISKGILYHYFKDKDELYLACVRALFDGLTDCLSGALSAAPAGEDGCLERYFDARLRFFREHPREHRLFCDVAIAPPEHLAQRIAESRTGFDAMNIAALTGILREKRLRPDLSVEAAVETFRLYQDFVNARYRMEPRGARDLERHEQICRRSLSVLLYGVLARGDEDEAR